MKKIILAAALLATLSISANAGVLHNNWAIGGGTETVDGLSGNPSAQLTVGAKYFWETGVALGGDVGIGLTSLPAGVLSAEETGLGSFDTNLKLGYSFGGDTGKGLGVYGTYGFRIGGSSYTYQANGEDKTKVSISTGQGVGAQVEYVFDNGLTVGTIYQTYTMTFDTVGIDAGVDTTNLSARIGYQW